MKKIILLSVICCLAFNAAAQETGYFDHLAIGVKAGTAGVGAELAAPVGPYFQVRAGYAIMPPLSYSRTVEVPEHPGAHGSDKGADYPVDAKATCNLSNAELLVDIFPFEQIDIHFTAGMLYGPKNAVKVTNTTPLPKDYDIIGLDVDGYTVMAVDRYIDGYVAVESLRPYLGVGWGSAVRSDRKVSFTCDLGAIYWGKPGLYAPGYDFITDNWKDVRITASSLNGHDKGLIEKAEKLSLYPMVNVHLFFNLF